MSSKRSVSFTLTGVGPVTSAAVLLDETVITGFFFPSGWATANVTFNVSADGVTYYPVKKADGTAVTLTACAASTFVAIAPSEMAWAGLYLSITSSVEQTAMTVATNSVRTF